MRSIITRRPPPRCSGLLALWVGLLSTRQALTRHSRMRTGSFGAILIGIAALFVGCPSEELDDDYSPEDVDGDGWTVEGGDCDDQDATVNPEARELCDDRDNDCDGTSDEGCPPNCGDGIAAGSSEECDGDDDRACPGQCSNHCACPATEPGELEIHVIDVGQGDAILVVSPDGFVMLLDAGEEGQAPSVLGYLDSQGLTELDYTMVSHMHDDHLGSMDDVLNAHSEVVACFDHGGDRRVELIAVLVRRFLKAGRRGVGV